MSGDTPGTGRGPGRPGSRGRQARSAIPPTIRRRSGGDPAAIRRRSGGDPAAIRRRSGGDPAAIRRRSGGLRRPPAAQTADPAAAVHDPEGFYAYSGFSLQDEGNFSVRGAAAAGRRLPGRCWCDTGGFRGPREPRPARSLSSSAGRRPRHGRSGPRRGRSGPRRGRSGPRRGRSGPRRGRSGPRRGRSGARHGGRIMEVHTGTRLAGSHGNAPGRLECIRGRRGCIREGAVMARVPITGSAGGLGLMAAKLLAEQGHADPARPQRPPR
jgi:transcription factor SPN1